MSWQEYLTAPPRSSDRAPSFVVAMGAAAAERDLAPEVAAAVEGRDRAKTAKRHGDLLRKVDWGAGLVTTCCGPARDDEGRTCGDRCAERVLAGMVERGELWPKEASDLSGLLFELYHAGQH